MTKRKFLSLCAVFFFSLVVAVSCSRSPEGNPTDTDTSTSSPSSSAPIVIGYSNWAGWWPWAIAQEEGLFEKNDANVETEVV